jgi:hypothetical protein
MAISRPLQIVLAVAVLVLVGFYATQGARQSNSDDGAAEVTPPPASDSASVGDATKPDAARSDTNKPDPAKSDAAKPDAARSDATKARERRSAGAARRREAAERRGMPLSVARALRDRKVVVLFFSGTSSIDDRATGRAVAALRGQRGVAVFADRIGRLGRYRAVVGDLGISQAPAVVIVDRTRSARVVEGYVDPRTLAQDVADAR